MKVQINSIFSIVFYDLIMCRAYMEVQGFVWDCNPNPWWFLYIIQTCVPRVNSLVFYCRFVYYRVVLWDFEVKRIVLQDHVNNTSKTSDSNFQGFHTQIRKYERVSGHGVDRVMTVKIGCGADVGTLNYHGCPDDRIRAQSVTVPVIPNCANAWLSGLNPSNKMKSTSTRFENNLDFIVVEF